MRMWLCALNICFLLGMSLSYAEARRGDLSNGMSSRDVILQWGEPLEIQEQEVKQLEVWHYPKGDRVVVREGKVLSWLRAGMPHGVHEEVRHAEPDAVARKVSAEAAFPAIGTGGADTRDLVREIAKELPAGSDLPYTEQPEAASPQGMPPAAAAVPAQPPQAGLYANPPAAGFQPYIANEIE